MTSELELRKKNLERLCCAGGRRGRGDSRGDDSVATVIKGNKI